MEVNNMGRPKVRLEKYTRRSINFDDDLWEELKRIALSRNGSVTGLIHNICREYVEAFYYLGKGVKK